MELVAKLGLADFVGEISILLCFLVSAFVLLLNILPFFAFPFLFWSSLRYHLLHPDYLYFRIRELQKNYRLRIILCHVDVVSPLIILTSSYLHCDSYTIT